MILDIIKKKMDNPQDEAIPVPASWMPIVVEAVFKDEAAAKEGEQKVKEVVRLILDYDPENNWPSNEEWNKLLPQWLIHTFRKPYTQEELDEMFRTKQWDNEWTLDGCIGLFEERVWEWWGSEVIGNNVIFHLLVDGWPYGIAEFFHLVQVVGAITVEDKG